MERDALKQLVKKVAIKHLEEQEIPIPIGVSNRHLHLTEADYLKLFPNEEIQVKKWLKQPGEFAAVQTVTISGPKGEIERVRILAPFRSRTQLEISKTDARTIGVKAPIRLSGDTLGTPGITLKTAAGEVVTEQGVIVAKRHIHLPTEIAAKLQLNQVEEVAVEVETDNRSLILKDCVVRINDNFKLEMHLDTDEANAANVTDETVAKLVRL